jgi:outer membrane protein insertion porin family
MLLPTLRRVMALLVVAVGALLAPLAVAQEEEAATRGSAAAVPELRPAPLLGELAGRPIRRIEIVVTGDRWSGPARVTRVRVGEPLGIEAARRAMRELTDTGRYASVDAVALPDGDGAALRITAVPRRIVASARVVGGTLDAEETLRAAGVHVDGELVESDLPKIASRMRDHYRHHGFPRAKVGVTAIDTDDPMGVVVLADVQPGPARRVDRLRFSVWPSARAPGLSNVLHGYAVSEGNRADEELVTAADRELEKTLRARGWHRAEVSHRFEPLEAGKTRLNVDVRAGPLVRLLFEGNRHFDAAQLEAALELDDSDDRTPTTLLERLENFYARRGFLDAEIRVAERGEAQDAIHDLAFTIRERPVVRVVAREYPLLSGERSPRDVGSEIDSFLSEELPGSGLLDTVDPRVVDQTLGPRHTTGARVTPLALNPWKTYVPEVYERAMKHVQDLYRSEGYLSATVGPAQLLRRRCQRRSPPGQCIPIGPRVRPRTECRYDEVGVPLEEPAPDPALACEPDGLKGLRCEPDAVLHIPIKLGPRTFIYDVAFEGNKLFIERDLAELSELELGSPASQVELDKARRRLLDAYAEEGFAFADVDTTLELSPDRTRARARFIISEREQVRVAGILIRGARRTNEGLIRSRVALEVGELYRRSDVRKTEERLATLGVFSTITVGLEDPYVPAKQKNVIITLAERKPQYLDVRPGFSTGEGFRITFEYGHRNLGGEAIQLTLRVQLGYLPNAFILEEDVRRKYDQLDVGQRLERRNSATLEFPEIGLGPLFRLSVEGIDVRDNARDFGLTKDAGIVTLMYRPVRMFSAYIGGSLELNTAEIFGDEETKEALEDYVRNNPRQRNFFRVPEGTTVAVAQRIGFSWDRRDNPLGATRGTLVSGSVEHVRATPVGEQAGETASGEPSVFAATISQFLRFNNRLGGYLRLDERGTALAASFRWGYNHQLLEDSQTYPDRLFFMGGMDSLRGYLQDSMVPEDIAEQLLDPNGELTLNEVLIRGGDMFINPRLELRIPLSGDVQTALFLDSGNLWRDPSRLNPRKLRYAVGTGLRIGTPIGPLVFDYGFNVDRVLDELYPERERQRFWEDIGAFHFSIGLF